MLSLDKWYDCLNCVADTEVFQHMFTSRLQEKLQASGIETGDSADVAKSLKYVCTICGKLEPSGGKLEIHMRKHTGEQPYRCDFCPRAFSNKSNKTKHVKMHHSNIWYPGLWGFFCVFFLLFQRFRPQKRLIAAPLPITHTLTYL